MMIEDKSLSYGEFAIFCDPLSKRFGFASSLISSPTLMLDHVLDAHIFVLCH